MDRSATSTNYRRRGDAGILKLGGVVDIFEARSVHEACLRVLNDTKATSVTINMDQVERIDISILQILLSLRHSLNVSGRTLLIAAPRRVADAVAQLGLAL